MLPGCGGQACWVVFRGTLLRASGCPRCLSPDPTALSLTAWRGGSRHQEGRGWRQAPWQGRSQGITQHRDGKHSRLLRVLDVTSRHPPGAQAPHPSQRSGASPKAVGCPRVPTHLPSVTMVAIVDVFCQASASGGEGARVRGEGGWDGAADQMAEKKVLQKNEW